jgi:hypothetical protein
VGSHGRFRRCAGRRHGSTLPACGSRRSRQGGTSRPCAVRTSGCQASSGRSCHSTLRWTAACAHRFRRASVGRVEPNAISSARWVSDSYIGVSTPVRAHSTSRATARALSPTCARRCRRVQPGSSDGSSNSSSPSSLSLRAPVRLPASHEQQGCRELRIGEVVSACDHGYSPATMRLRSAPIPSTDVPSSSPGTR